MRPWVLSTALLCACFSLSAATLAVTATGTFGASVPVSTVTIPNASWSASFNVASSPTPTFFSSGSGFDATVTNFVYTVNGSATNLGSATVTFYDGPATMVFKVGQNQFQLIGPKVYSGSDAAPTLLTGQYAEINQSAVVPETGTPVGPGYPDYYMTGVNITIATASTQTPTPTPTATPVPPSLILALIGLAAAGVFFAVSRRQLKLR